MGCDFCVVTKLRIEHFGGYKCVELHRGCGWYGNYDSDDPDQPDRVTYNYEQFLKPRPPMVLFDNNRWCSRAAKKKYGQMVRKTIGGLKLLAVIKEEYRYDCW